ncbi:hypothetical protein CEXT_4361 [Caerostris extrusa]|uniref:Uncharacterized protein n=1 Tax=Caerostris extrusa TaxID=172846 RepID=A0AAV4QZY6_CAEEX|nr:hypothetical protein CEXT_4361 [Caerostris extrusa]
MVIRLKGFASIIPKLSRGGGMDFQTQFFIRCGHYLSQRLSKDFVMCSGYGKKLLGPFSRGYTKIHHLPDKPSRHFSREKNNNSHSDITIFPSEHFIFAVEKSLETQNLSCHNSSLEILDEPLALRNTLITSKTENHCLSSEKCHYGVKEQNTFFIACAFRVFQFPFSLNDFLGLKCKRWAKCTERVAFVQPGRYWIPHHI